MLARPLMTTPDDHRGCEAYCEELKAEVWRLDRLIAGLRAAAVDADRHGKAIDVDSFLRAAGEPVR